MLENMRQMRKSKGLTMKQLGDLVGVAEVTISTYETGKREPSLDILCKIADELDVSLDMLVRGKEKDHSEEWSLEALLKMYRGMSVEQLEFTQVALQAALGDKRFQAHLHQDGK